MADTNTQKPRRSWRRLAFTVPLSLGLGAAALTGGNFLNTNIVPVYYAQHSRQAGPEPRESKSDGLAVATTPSPQPTSEPDLFTPGQIAFGGDQERMNLLVLGIDYDYTDKDQPFSKNARSDSTMVISLDDKASLLNVVSIPRDSRVEITPKHGLDKLNVAYSLGGPTQAKATIGNFLKTNLDHYVVVRVDAAAKMVDAVGGIDIAVEKSMDYDDNWGHLHVHLKKGMQHLNGAQTVGYCRFRHDDESDRGRMRRQQQVIQVLLGKLHDPRTAGDIPQIVSVIKNSVDTDLRAAQILDLARLYAGFDRKKMKTAQLAGDDAMIDGVSYLIPTEATNKPIIRTLLKDPKDLVMEDARIEVLNGAGVAGVAKQTADLLTAKGFQVVRVGDADRSDYPNTEIVDHLRNRRVRSKLMQVLNQAQVEEQPGEGTADVTIIVGRGDLTASDTQTHTPSLGDGPSYPTHGAPVPAPAVTPAGGTRNQS